MIIKHRRTPNKINMSIVATIFASIALGIFVACGGNEPDVGVTRGNVLEIQVESPVMVEKIVWSDMAGQHRVIKAKATNRRLALVKVSVINRKSTIVPLLIETQDAEIGDRDGNRVYSLNPFKDARVQEKADPQENRYTPFLMAIDGLEIELERDFMVSGWMVFEVPLGLNIGTLWWNEVESLTVDFR